MNAIPSYARMLVQTAPLVVITLYTTNVHSQVLEWAGQLEGPYHSPVIGLCQDPSSNLYCTGFYQGTTDFDIGTGSYPLPAPGGEVYIYVAKYDPLGQVQWAERFGSGFGNVVYGTNIASDNAGAIYVAGQFSETGDFDPGPGTLLLNAAGWPGNFDTDVFVMELDTSGALQWALQIGDSASDYCRDMVLDPSGNVLLAIDVADTADLDPGPGSSILYNTFPLEAVLVKLDPNGGLLWFRELGASGGYRWISLGTDTSGAIWVATDERLRKYDPAGTLLFDLPLAVITADLAVDPLGNAYLIGTFEGSVDVDPGSGVFNLNAGGMYDLFCAKVSPLGDLEWAVQLGGSGQTDGWGIDLGPEGSVYLTGSHTSMIDLDPCPGIWLTTAMGGTDVLLVTLDSLGIFQEAMTLSGAGEQYAYDRTAVGPSEWMVYGGFEQTVDFDPGVSTYPLTSTTYSDGFLAKYSSPVMSIEDDHPVSRSVMIHPVPSSDQLTVTGLSIGSLVVVNDGLGHVLIEHLYDGEGPLRLDMRALPSGPCWVRVIDDKGVVCLPALIAR